MTSVNLHLDAVSVNAAEFSARSSISLLCVK